MKPLAGLPELILYLDFDGCLQHESVYWHPRRGATYHSEMLRNLFAQLPRGLQVGEDVLRRKPRYWLALDDDYRGWPTEFLDKQIRTHPYEGISDPEVLAELKTKLAEMCK